MVSSIDEKIVPTNGSCPLLVMSGEAWDTLYISTGEARTANRERPPRVHASTAPADH
jgi:hypothetical protein